MVDLVRASSLIGYTQLVAELGGDPAQLLKTHGITPEVAGNHEEFVAYSSLAAVVGGTAEALHCPDFGLQLALSQNISILGPVALLAQNASTVGEALAGLANHLHTYSPSIRVQLDWGATSSRYTFAILLRQLASRDHMVELSLGVGLSLLQFIISPTFVPSKVRMRHPQISGADTYRKHFGRPVEFESTENSLEIPNWVLDRPIEGRDAAVHALAEKYLAATRAHLALADQVGDLVDRLLPLRQASLGNVAGVFAIHPRVLQRELAKSGTSFGQILDETRKTLALQLSAVGLSVAQISKMLGYSEQSSYTRACRQWFGESPRQLIARVRISTEA